MVFGLVLILLPLLLLAYARWVEPSLLVTRQVEFTAGKTGGEPLRLVFFSDTHFDKATSAAHADRIAAQINAESPDLVIFGGDLMDSYHRSPPDLVLLEKALSAISAKYGKFAVYGNHDYGGGARQVYAPLMERSGFRVLCNESVSLDGADISITGVDDYQMGHPDLDAPRRAERKRYNLTVSHAPDLTDRLKLEGMQLVLSGHTHGGQVYLPIPAMMRKILPPGGQKYRKGEFLLEEATGRRLYVSSGIGMTQVPLRFQNPPEIISISIVL